RIADSARLHRRYGGKTRNRMARKLFPGGRKRRRHRTTISCVEYDLGRNNVSRSKPIRNSATSQMTGQSPSECRLHPEPKTVSATLPASARPSPTTVVSLRPRLEVASFQAALLRLHSPRYSSCPRPLQPLRCD